jgi:N-acetylmuramoyl-L-alanine amidase
MLVHTLLVIIRNRSVGICNVLFSGFYNYINLGISVIGDYSSRKPNAAAINAVKSLINCGVSKGYIKSGYSLRGHRYVLSIECIYIYINLLFHFF